jgi:hypothetical protein
LAEREKRSCSTWRILINFLLFTAEQLGKETGFNRIISVALATIFFSYAL